MLAQQSNADVWPQSTRFQFGKGVDCGLAHSSSSCIRPLPGGSGLFRLADGSDWIACAVRLHLQPHGLEGAAGHCRASGDAPCVHRSAAAGAASAIVEDGVERRAMIHVG